MTKVITTAFSIGRDGNPNRFYCGDNLEVLRTYMQENETVDLIYLDPPFHSDKDYNLLFVPRDRDARPRAQVKAFKDTWDWNESASAEYNEIISSGHPSSVALEAFRRLLGPSKMLAYLSMMSLRLIELHRVLKPTGSLYVHCDPSASHYLRVILDAILGPDNFRNELIWKRTNAHNSAKRYGPVHDAIFFYTKTSSYTWNPQFMAYSEQYLKKFRKIDPFTGKPFREVTLTGPGVRSGDSGKIWGGWDVTQRGRHWQPATYVYKKYLAITGVELNTLPLLRRLDELDRIGMIYWPNKNGGEPCYKFFLEDAPGVPLQDVWTDIDAINSQAVERLGYPTQKPIELMERIIRSSSNEGDLVLDPFCGCGTTIHAAHRHRRRWIGIDISAKAEKGIAKRLSLEFGEIGKSTSR